MSDGVADAASALPSTATAAQPAMQRPPPSSSTAVLRPPAPSASSSAGSSPATSEKALATWKALAATSPLPNGTAPSAATDEGDEAEAVAEAAAKAASAAACKVAFRFRVMRPGEFEPQHHFYPRCLNAQIHPSVRFFMGLSRERLISRYTHLNPRVDPVELRRMLSYQPRYLRWAGCDLMHVVDSRTQSKSMVVIETNSCPSGQKSTPLFDDQDEYGGYRLLIQRALLSRLQSGDEPVVPGKLAVLFDKNPMEASGYAACLAELTDEEVLLVPMFDDAADAEEPVAEANAGATRPHRRPVSFFRDGILYVRRPRPTSAGNGAAATDTCNGNGRAGRRRDSIDLSAAAAADAEWEEEEVPIRAALRYVTQRPWNRIPTNTRTIITNSVVSCLAGGRNKLVAAKAYDNANVELMACGLEIRTPHTIRDVPLHLLSKWVERLGGFAAIKVPYSNAGQGVYTITSPEEFRHFYEAESQRPNRYDKYIVQSLISNHEWSSHAAGLSHHHAFAEPHGRLYHVGTMPDKRGHIYVNDLRMMVSGGTDGFVPVGLYARRARAPLSKEPGNNSWEQLGTNLSVKLGEGLFSSESERLMLMDRKDFNVLGLSLDDLIDAFVETCLAVRAIDMMARWLCSDGSHAGAGGGVHGEGRFSLSLFRSVCGDDSLIREIVRGNEQQQQQQ